MGQEHVAGDKVGSHVRLFRLIGRVPRLIVPDNLKSGVNRTSFYNPEINRSFGIVASYYGVGVLPARPKRPKDSRRSRTVFVSLSPASLDACAIRPSSRWPRTMRPSLRL